MEKNDKIHWQLNDFRNQNLIAGMLLSLIELLLIFILFRYLSVIICFIIFPIAIVFVLPFMLFSYWNYIDAPTKIGFSNKGIHFVHNRSKKFYYLVEPKSYDKIIKVKHVPIIGVNRIITFPDFIEWQKILKIYPTQRTILPINYAILAIISHDYDLITIKNVSEKILIDIYGQFRNYQSTKKNYIYDKNYTHIYNKIEDIPSE